VLNPPGAPHSFLAFFWWHGPTNDEHARWISKLESLAPTAMSDTKKMTLIQSSEAMTALLPLNVYGHTATASLSHFSEEAAKVIAKRVALMPKAPGVMLAVHCIYGDACLPENQLPSVWRHREPHQMMEIVGMPVDQQFEDESVAWAEDFGQELREVDAAMEGLYVAMSSREIDTKKVYGDQYDFLMRMKEKHDPDRVFKHAAPSL
jgi:hypothetical protein